MTIMRWAALRRVGAAAVLLGGLWSALPAQAQVWTTNGCSGCHGLGPNIANTVADNSNNMTLGLGESWMADSTQLRTRVNAAGTFTGISNMQSANFSAANAAEVWAYFVDVRDGNATSVSRSLATKVNSTTTSSFSVTLTNYRGAAASYSLSFAGTGSADYSVQSHTATGTGCSAGNLPAATTLGGSACTVNITVAFTPSLAGSRNATLRATLSSPGTAQTIATLTGTGQTASFAITPSSRTVSAKVGSSATTTYTITNNGAAVLDLTSITFSSARFTLGAGNTCTTAGTSNVAAGGGTCTLVVAFTPLAAGDVVGQVNIGHDGVNVSSPAQVSVTGTGTVPVIASNVSTLDFQQSQVGVPKALPGAITLTNNGDASLVFSANPFTVGGSHPGDFSFGGTCAGATVTPGNSCTVNGTFTPAATGARSATLSFNSDASNVLPAITLSGTGVALPEPVVVFPNQAFPDTVIGETGAQTRQVTITNARTRDITYSVANTTDFNIAPGGESCATRTVPGGGGSCTITWRFQPVLGSGEGPRQGNLTFTFAGTLGDPAPSNVNGQLTGNALLPIAQSASVVNAAAVVGSPTTSSLLLTNRSAGSVTLSNLAFSGTAASDYSLDATNGCTVGGVLAAGANCSLVVQFNPPAAGTRNATLTITHTAPGSPQTVTLNGTATPAPQGRIDLSTLSLSFPDTQLGGSSVLPITVQNSGNLALNFSAFNLTGTAAADYERGGTCSTSTPLAIGAQCTVTMTFRPGALGVRSASLTILSDASNGPATITLSGTGVPVPVPVVTLTPGSIDFGTQTVGGFYPSRTIRLSNTGTADLLTSAIAVEGTAFSDASATSCTGTLAPGAGCDIAIAFAPPSAGTDFTGTLRVTSNAAGSPHTAALLGRGSLAAVPVLVWSPVVTQLDFGTISTGTVSGVQSATLLNQGPGGVTLTVLNAVGSGAASFSVAGGTCQVGQALFEGQSCRVDVRFAPSSAGARSATVQVASTGSFPPELSLTGTGLGGPSPGMALSLASLAFDDTRVGTQSLPSEITLRSTGSGTLQVTALTVTGPYTVSANTCPVTLPFGLPAGGECTLSVAFVPQSEGDTTGTLRVTTDADPASADVALSGHGDPPADLSSGGGCSLASGESATDPTLWTLVLLAALVLFARRRARRRS
ncbi:MAG: choice-of-anchor D domain-containing protein [Piscinibacter sp.]|nr:choice-of-anchor D domain-containing protein [Piscinibacter sp.]